MRFHDAGLHPDGDTYYPELVDTFEELGFVRVGHLLPTVEPGSFDDSVFTGQDQRELRNSLTTASPVLRSPEADAFVEISRWCGSPMLRFWTLLVDGALVSTLSPIQRLPQLATASPFVVQLDVDTELIRSSVPAKGRSSRMAPTSTPVEIWHEHQEHASSYATDRATRRTRHESVAQVISITEQALQHAHQCQRHQFRYVYAGIALAGSAMLIATMVVMASLVVRTENLTPLITLGFAIGVPIAGIFGVRALMRSVFKWRRIRPGFRFRPS